MSDFVSYVDSLVTAMLLGTDRRPVPDPPPGPLAEFAGECASATSTASLLQGVVAATAARRAGWLPGPTLPPAVDDPTADRRRVTTPEVAATWRQIVSDWPVLEDEWLEALVDHGWRTGPELTLPLLLRHRGHARRIIPVAAACGPIVDVLFEAFPELRPPTRRTPPPPVELVTLERFTALLHAPAKEFIAELVGGMHAGRYVTSHRQVLEHAVATVAPSTLPVLADALEHLDPSLPTIGIALALAELARLRHLALAQLSEHRT